MPPRVLLADDHEVVRQALKALLERHGFQVVGEAPDGRAAVDAACRLRPDIAVLDVAMPLLNGVDAARELCRMSPATRVILLTALEDALPAAVDLLHPGGRIAVISFHSLEDRIVKRFLREQEQGCTCPPDFPVCTCGREPVLRATPRRAIRARAAETAANPRAASARLRAAVKV